MGNLTQVVVGGTKDADPRGEPIEGAFSALVDDAAARRSPEPGRSLPTCPNSIRGL